jgi:hypothetical protein
MIDATCISAARILWRATRKYNMLLVTENRRRHKHMVWWMLTWLDGCWHKLHWIITWRVVDYDVAR